MPTRLETGADREIRKIVAVYALFGSAWIYLSDSILAWFIHNPEIIHHIEVFKGILFILITSALLYHLIGRFARRNAETIRQLAESESRFEAIFNNVNDALIIHDATGRIVDVNRTMCSIFGFSRDEALHLQVQDLSLGEAPYSQSDALRLLEQAAQGVPQVFEWRSRKKDGTVFWSEVNMRSATLNGENQVIVMVRDISERKEAAEALRQSEESLKRLMEEMPAGVCWTNEAGTVEYLNSAIIYWFGYTQHDVPTIEEWMKRALPDPRYRENFREMWAKAVEAAKGEGPQSPPIETGVICKDGSRRHVILNIRRVRHRILYIFTDITKRESMQSELLKTQKLESLGVLAGGIAHDFNNILTGILGNISFAGMLLESDHPARKPVSQAEKASLRAAELAHQLLTFAKGGQPVKKAVSVANLVQESLSLSLHGSNARVLVEVPADLDAIEADEGQINQAFNNVIINALQAMSSGGTLIIKGENVTLDDENTLGLAAGQYVKISFSDEGSGIAQEDMVRIFDPYFTTKAGGTGLGLASVHSIVSKHNGKIVVTSRVGKGTTFTFYLPSAGEAAADGQFECPPETEGTGIKGAVLVMDDEETIRVLAQNILEYLGYTVTTCSTGDEAVMLYREAKEAGTPFLAAIMDLTVPAGMGGKEAARQILSYDPKARLIVSSGYSNDPVMASHQEYGFCAAIVKPYRCAEIQQAMSEAHSQDTTG